MDKEITFFAKTNFRNEERVFGIKTDDRRRHMYVIGKTGMGKTNLLENMAIQDIQNGHGVCFIDPHGDTAEKIIRAIPASRINDVIYFNPADQQFPIAFNVIEKVDPEYRHLVVSGLVGVFKKIWADSWGPRLEYILRNAILALLEYPGSTLLGVTRMLVDKKYRMRVVAKITDPVVRSFWVDEFTGWNERVLQEVISPIQNKVGQFLSTSLIRNIIGQTQSSFDVRKIMDEKKILIMNLSKGRIGEDSSALLGAMMITKVQLAAMGRVDIPEKERRDFYLYVDEFQNFATLAFANILSEARKYRLNLILANQYITQIEEEVRDAVFGNAGTLIAFRVGATDAEFLEKEFAPVFTETDVVNLPKYNVYLKLMIDGIAGDAFSATTLPPVDLADTEDNAEKVIRVTRERYASSKKDVEEKISRWAGVILPVSAEHIVAAPVKRTIEAIPAPRKEENPAPTVPAPDVKKEETRSVAQDQDENLTEPKPMYQAKCDTCDLDILIPFKPDGQRPTFCKECLKDYQRAVAKSKSAEDSKRQKPTARPVSEQRRTFSPRQERSVDPRREIAASKPGGTRKAFVPSENPLSLNQLPHIAPKKFKGGKRTPDLGAIRQLIGKSRG